MEVVFYIVIGILLIIVLPKDPKMTNMTSQIATDLLSNPVPLKNIVRESSDAIIGVWCYSSHTKIARFLDEEMKKRESFISYEGGEPSLYDLYREWSDNARQVNEMFDRQRDIQSTKSSNTKSSTKILKFPVAN